MDTVKLCKLPETITQKITAGNSLTVSALVLEILFPGKLSVRLTLWCTPPGRIALQKETAGPRVL